jgi:predicted PurR-regulated permease PerM
LGFLAGVFNLVPYLGVVIAITPSLLLALSQGWGQVLGVLVVFVAANQFEAHLLSPLVLARATQLHPATVIVAILLGASLLGLWGAVLAVPAAAFLKLVYSDYYLTSCLYKEG